MELKRKPRGEKIYRGAYKYFKGETVYCEEDFEIYRDRKELSLNFFATQHSRVATGELLTVYIDYQVSKAFIPKKVLIEKSLGKEIVQEVFDYNPNKNTLDYLFISKSGQEHREIIVPPKFSISTPSALTSMLYLKTKKEDTTATNFYMILGTTNQWTFDEVPKLQALALDRAGLGTEGVMIEGHTVQATPYKIYDAEELNQATDKATLPFVRIFLSKYITIPYKVISEDGTKAQIKYLNDLDKNP